MGAVPQAKTCYYKGIKFKSNLEGKTAEALDNLGIRWEYEPCVFRGPQFIGGQYTPDFLLTGTNIYIEVAGVWDKRHAKNAEQVLNENVQLGIVDNNGFLWQAWREVEGNRLHACFGIQSAGTFMPFTEDDKSLTDWNRYMITLNGAPFIERWDSSVGEWNLFDAAGVKRYGGPR